MREAYLDFQGSAGAQFGLAPQPESLAPFPPPLPSQTHCSWAFLQGACGPQQHSGASLNPGSHGLLCSDGPSGHSAWTLGTLLGLWWGSQGQLNSPGLQMEK